MWCLWWNWSKAACIRTISYSLVSIGMVYNNSSRILKEKNQEALSRAIALATQRVSLSYSLLPIGVVEMCWHSKSEVRQGFIMLETYASLQCKKYILHEQCSNGPKGTLLRLSTIRTLSLNTGYDLGIKTQQARSQIEGWGLMRS